MAVDRDKLRNNPLENVEYENPEPAKYKYITRDELKRIMETTTNNPITEICRHAFIFSSFTGMSQCDVKKLRPHDIHTTPNKNKYIKYKRKKTGVEAYVPLHPVAEQIMNLYNVSDNDKPVFNLPYGMIVWANIVAIGFAAGIKEQLGYHMARHTFATLLLTSGVSLESLSKMMGHKSIKSTQIYAIVTDDKILTEMSNLSKQLKED